MKGCCDQTNDGGMPIHLPFDVDAEGNGPTAFDEAADHLICWCGQKCYWLDALQAEYARGYIRASEAIAVAIESDTLASGLDLSGSPGLATERAARIARGCAP